MAGVTTSYDGDSLGLLIEQLGAGNIQIPEFQREFALQDEWVADLLASVSLRYPIGAVTLLQTGSPDLRFKTRPVAHARTGSIALEWLLLDGQQRMTTLYQALASDQAVLTFDDAQSPVNRWYYIDLDLSVDQAVNRDEAIASVSDTRRGRTPHGQAIDVSTVESEWEHCLFPLRLVFGAPEELRHWQEGFVRHGSGDQTAVRSQLLGRFGAEIIAAFNEYRVPTIKLPTETTRWSVRVHGGPDGKTLSDRYRVAGT